jgi:hypothetical protein
MDGAPGGGILHRKRPPWGSCSPTLAPENGARMGHPAPGKNQSDNIIFKLSTAEESDEEQVVGQVISTGTLFETRRE